MYNTVDENPPERKTGEKPIDKKLAKPVLFLIPTILLILSIGAIMGAIAGFMSTPEMREDSTVKFKVIASEDRRITEPKKNEQTTTEAKPEKVEFIEKKEPQKIVHAESGNINNEIIFKVQFLSSKNPIGPNSPRFKGLKNVWEYEDGGLYKYTIGNLKDIQSASALQSESRKKGFGDAFVVAFKNGKRIPVREAL
jgi:N-acetylmuramoyl-L-alanine amidase